MIDQSIPTLVTSPPPQQSYARDASANTTADDGSQGPKFENYVSAAEQKNNGGNSPRQQSEQGADTKLDPADEQQASPAVLTTKQATGTIDNRLKLIANLQRALQGMGGDKSASLIDELKAASKQLVAKSQDANLQKTSSSTSPTGDMSDATEALNQLLGLSGQKSAGTPKVARKDDRTADATSDKKAPDSNKTDNATKADSRADSSGMTELASLLAKLAGSQADVSEDDSPDAAVRVVSADGKGTPVDIPLGKADAKTSDAKNAIDPTKLDTATVIDARRYLGFSSESNAGNLAKAISQDPGWSEALSRAGTTSDLDAATIKDVNTLKLQMNPENLGNMVASLTLKGEELSVQVRVETAEAYRHLTNDQDGLVKALQDQGYNIDQVTIQLVPTDKSDQSPSDNQRSAAGNSGNGQANDGQGSSGRQTAGNTWQADDDSASATYSGVGSDPGGTGNLYL
jgi:chemotaxis protein MotD